MHIYKKFCKFLKKIFLFVLYRLGNKTLKLNVSLVLCFQYAIAMIVAAFMVILFDYFQKSKKK